MAIGVTVLTVSDRSFRGEREDLSGPAVCEKIKGYGWALISTAILPDDLDLIKDYLFSESQKSQVNLILTTGGTGFAPRDVTPEATLAILDKRAPGLCEIMRFEAYKNNKNAILSRAEAGLCGNTLIINLPGNPKGAVENLSIIAPLLPHALALVSQIPDFNDFH